MSRTYVIADIHGRLDLLDAARGKIMAMEPAKSGRIVFLGDYIDRGPDSAGCIARLMAGPPDGWEWVIIRGNHEDMALECHGGKNLDWWVGNGGGATIASYGGAMPEDHLAWLDTLPRLWSDAHRVYVHAGVQEAYALDEQPEAVTQWMRYPKGADVGYRGKHVVHGHTPVDRPELLTCRTNLDTGAVFTGRLTVAIFDDDVPGGPQETFAITEART